MHVVILMEPFFLLSRTFAVSILDKLSDRWPRCPKVTFTNLQLWFLVMMGEKYVGNVPPIWRDNLMNNNLTGVSV